MKYINLFENFNNNIFYHGSSTLLPFESFDEKMEGTGIVSAGNKKYGGFFFTSEIENAEFYTEWWVVKVEIKNLNETNVKNPIIALEKSKQTNENYLIKDILDGYVYSNIAVVPHQNLNDIEIKEWIFIGDKEDYYEKLDDIFGTGSEDNFITKYMIEDTLNIIGGFEYLIDIPIFKEYYESKDN